jgi:NAD(P)-dependent dehydrogenase (short-subunit alcohol dehydrogenase family)
MLFRNLAIELPRRCRPVACVAVHPGTTRTRLSAPFEQSLAQLNVHEAEDTAGNLIRVAQSLSDQDNGRFINWDGTDLPW